MPFGVAQLFGSDAMFGTWLRQNGKELFTTDGPGFEVADAEAWFDMMVKFQKAEAIGTARADQRGGIGQAAGPECGRGRESRHAVLQLQSAGSDQQGVRR